jgi:hypothetical protein
VFAFDRIPDLIARISASTRSSIDKIKHNTDFPDVNRITPIYLLHRLWWFVQIWLHVMILLFISTNSRAKIAQYRFTKSLGLVKISRGIDWGVINLNEIAA